MAIFLCFLPLLCGIILFTFAFRLKFVHQLVAALLGLVAVVPSSFAIYFFPQFSGIQNFPLYSLLKSLLVIGLLEEAFKTVFVALAPHKNYSPRDFLLLSFVVGLAFACFESSVYYFDHLQLAVNRRAELLYVPIFIRIFTSDLIHLTCTGLCGLFVYSIRIKKTKLSFLLTAILIHGVFDFFAAFQNPLKYFSFVVILFAIIECHEKYRRLKNLAT